MYLRVLLWTNMFRVLMLFLFFFKQKTAYEMRISDWSSDVCSSDLDGLLQRLLDAGAVRLALPAHIGPAIIFDGEGEAGHGSEPIFLRSRGRESIMPAATLWKLSARAAGLPHPSPAFLRAIPASRGSRREIGRAHV